MIAHGKLRSYLVGMLALLTVGGTFAGAAGIDDFSLTRAIPADVCFAAHSRNHDGLEFVNAQYERVWTALENARLDRQLKYLLKTVYREQGMELDDFESTWLEISDLLAGVEWSTLFKQECAVAMKFGTPPEVILLMRPPKDQLAGDYRGFSAILKKLVALDPSLEVTEITDGESAMIQFNLPGILPVAATLAREGDTLLVGFGVTLVEQSLALLKGEVEGTLSDSDRFKKAFAELPAPTDEFTYVDFERLLAQIRQATGAVLTMGEATGADEELGELDVVNKLIDAIDMFDYLAEVKTTKGMRQTCRSTLVLRENAKSKPFYAAIFGNKPLQEPLKMIPVQAGDVTVTNGVNLHALYQALLKFVSEQIPEGEDAVAKFKEKLTELPFDLETDLLTWIDGGFSSFTIPGPTPFSPGDWLLAIKVKDGEKAQEMVNRGLVEVAALLEAQSGNVIDVEIDGAEGFKGIDMPAIATMLGMRPTIGIADGQLLIGSGVKPVELALAAAKSGKTFAKNERYIKEGLPLADNVVSMSFHDTSKVGETWAGMLQMAPMIGALAPPEVQSNPVLRAAFGVAGRLAPVAREFNFFLSSCSQTTFDGRTLVTDTLVNYQEPPKPAEE